MKKTYKKYIENFNVNLLDCKLLGKGHNGIVFLLPDSKVLKICFSKKSLIGEYYILRRVKNNKYFPKVYGMCGNYMVRDCVYGMCLTKYIKKNGLDRELTVKIIELLKEFEKLKFMKLDVRCKDIYVQEDKSLKIIDPKKFYSKKRSFPRHLCKGLYRLKVLDSFMAYVKEEDFDMYKKWNYKVYKYIYEIKDENNILE